MSAASAAVVPLSTLDEDAWDDLLSFIEESRVIPIVGPELLLVATERGPRLLLDWVAERLAVRLNVNIADLPQQYQRELKARNRGDVWQPTELAAALYAQALTDPGRRTSLLKEAGTLLDAAPPALRALHDVQAWRERIRTAERGAQAAPR
jgi:hypothetical protein